MRQQWRKTGVPPDGYVIVPPDGKWGWMVLVGCIICGYVGVTISVAFGVIMNDLIAEFQTNAAGISWVSAVHSSVSGILGPMSTIMANMLSCRRTVIIGGFCCSLGLILSSFANGVEVLILTFGVLTGVGNCLVFVTLQVVLSCYFRKYYGIAMGILFSGYATSKVTTTPIIQILLDNYGWRGTLLIAGGFLMNIVVGGCLFQPAKWHSVLAPVTDNAAVANPPLTVAEDNQKIDTERTAVSQNEINSKVDHSDDTPSMQSAAEFKIELEKQLSKRMPLLRPLSSTERKGNEMISSQRSLNRRLSAVSGSAFELNGPLSAEVLKMSVDTPEPESEGKANRGQTIFSRFRDNVARSIDVTLFKERLFYVIVTHYSLLLAVMVYSTLFMYAFGVGAGLQPMEAAGLVSARSIGEIVGRSLGPLTLAALKLPTLPSFIVGITLSAAIFIVQSQMNTLTTLYAVSALSGTVFGAAVSMNPIILLELMGPKRLSSVIGLCTFFQGFLVLAVGPLIGWVCDVTGTYSSCLILLGIVQILIALTWITNLLINKYSKT